MTTRRSSNRKVLTQLEAISGKKLTFGNLLSAISQGEDQSQTAFGKRLGISEQYVCDLEHSRRFPSPKAAATYAEILGYSPSQFVRL